jgi:hypothetical protein
VDLLLASKVYPFEVGERSYVVITSPEGANRVYETGEVAFRPAASSVDIVDEAGRRWRVEENALVSTDGSEMELPRAVSNRAFWFGWYAQFPDTTLIR